MEADDVIKQVDMELMQLQDTLKDRLRETQDLGDLNNKVFNSSLQIEEHTAELEKTAVKTKWKWMFEHMKWLIIAGSIIGLLVLILLRLIFK